MCQQLFTRGSMVATLGAFCVAPVLAQSAAPAAPPGAIDDLVTANRILADQEILDGFGHVSIRTDANPNRFLMSRSMAPALVTADDIMEFDLDGNAVDPRGRSVFLERFIHSEIYKARPDVKAVVHAHTPAIIPFGVVSSVPLLPMIHLAAFLLDTVPVFEIRDAAGPGSDLLVRNPQLGAALARTLGDHPIALMRGHGFAGAGVSIKQVVFRSIYTVVNARLEQDALRLGRPNFLTPAEAVAAAKTNDPLIERPWELWKMRALRKT